MKPIIFPQAGNITLVKYSSDGTLDFANAVTAVGTVQSITPGVNYATSELQDGNSQWPLGIFDTGINATLRVSMSSFQPNLYAALIGTNVTEAANDTLWAVEEGAIVPSASPYEVTLAYTPVTGGTIIVAYTDGKLLTQVTDATSLTAAGQYYVSGSTITFHSADAGKEVLITYEYSATNVTSFGIPESVIRPALHAIISVKATDESQVGQYNANIIIDKCKGEGNINTPALQKDPQAWEFTLRVLKPRHGMKAVDFKYAVA